MSSLNKVCSQYSYSDNYRTYFAFSPAESIVVEVIAPISFFFACINFFFFWKFPNARQPPFDILLFNTIFSMLIISVYVSTLIYNSYYPPSLVVPIPESFSNFCLASGTIEFFAEMGASSYNMIFCFYYSFKIKNPLKSWVRENKQIHGLCLLVAAFATLIVYLSNEIGVTILGVCGLKVSKTSLFIELGITVMYFFILGLTSIIFLKYLKKISKYDSNAKNFFHYFLVYTILVILDYFLQSISTVVLTIDCFVGLSEPVHQGFAIFTNILILIIPIIITAVISFHPEFRRNFIPSILKIFKREQQETHRQSYFDDLLTTNSNPMTIELRELNRGIDGYLSNIKQQNRISLLATILGCLSLEASQSKMHENMQNRSSMGAEEDDHIFSWNMSDQYEVKINEKITGQLKQYFVAKITPMQMNLISYSSSVFHSLMQSDEVDFIEKSTNPYNNMEQICKNVQSNGGRSGQFFFFTFDNRVLIKTITNSEKEVLLSRMEAYYNYFKYHPESLIVKIYGVYTIISPETDEVVNFMLMGNLCERIDRKYVHRVYDLKGSTHHREVFKAKDVFEESEYSKKTMKDIDFGRLEEKIWISSSDSKKIKQILKTDSKFFAQNGLIDYSLIIVKVDFNAYTLDQSYEQSSTGLKDFNSRTMFHSIKQPGMVYIIGIIDYLETWNVKKKGEKWYKSIWTQSSGISSQSPEYYSQRFCENLIDKIFSV